jgi:CRP/FNR family transcriptional regulator, cyclic AMP receptor protein
MNSIKSSNSSNSDTFECAPPTACRNCLASSGLATSGQLAEFTDDDIDSLSAITSIRRLSNGEILIAEGDRADCLYSIARGEFQVTHGRNTNNEVPLIRLGPGTITGELAFLDGLKRTATVKATTENSCVIALERDKLESIIESNPRLVYKVMRAILRSAHRTVGSMDRVYTDLLHYIRG